ncbi:sporulation protein rmd1, partial [Linderina pennispora]
MSQGVPINRRTKQARLLGNSDNNQHAGSYPPRMRREIVVPPSGMHRTAEQLSRQRPAFRTTKTMQKLKLLPEDDNESTDADEYVGLPGVYDQVAHMRGAQELRGEINRLKALPPGTLPRVTAYATASSYTMTQLFKWIEGRRVQNEAAPKLLDECIYSPFVYAPAEAITIDVEPSLLEPDSHA